jgi:hypothetical protein
MGATGPDDPSRSGIRERTRLVRTLGAVVDDARRSGAVRKDDLSFGDRVIVRTRNSIYSLWALGGDTFAVSGGWFDKHGDTPATVTVNGCTYGGSLIRHDVVAAPGLFLEFGNTVSTTRIRDVRVIRWNGPGDADAPAQLPC